ncbi:hypothetical protein L596_030920 [Steinernema carpocapsae]|uniref:Uncharacterized protein n=1 Tax=Steinernema carpocapsae TaxID=34508 RepID=A0A4U5MHC3_STECR|nr:hypothetical protein L596_030920 [Steinernema carpocapsae]
MLRQLVLVLLLLAILVFSETDLSKYIKIRTTRVKREPDPNLESHERGWDDHDVQESGWSYHGKNGYDHYAQQYYNQHFSHYNPFHYHLRR